VVIDLAIISLNILGSFFFLNVTYQGTSLIILSTTVTTYCILCIRQNAN
jgi:hypothetical protein